MAKTYRLRVTAGPQYDPSTHRLIRVNAPHTAIFENDSVTIALSVRVQDYAGFPEGSPITTSYFSNPIHCRDQYSISFSFIPKKNINGDDLVFGNDFDRPVRDRLPPGFNLAFKLAKWIMDPGLDGKLLVDKPYLYGPALSSLNIFRVGEKKLEKASGSKGWKLPATLHKDVVQEGADGSGKEVRREYNVPEQADKRRKWFLNKPNREKFQFEEGRLYEADFFNPYICFSEFTLKLPGFSFSVLKYIDDKTHELRHVLKNKVTGEVYCVILFTLLWGQDLANAEKAESTGYSNNSRESRYDDVD